MNLAEDGSVIGVLRSTSGPPRAPFSAKARTKGLGDAAGDAGDPHDAVRQALVLGEAHAIRRSVSGSNRQAARMSARNDAGWPSGRRTSGGSCIEASQSSWGCRLSGLSGRPPPSVSTTGFYHRGLRVQPAASG